MQDLVLIGGGHSHAIVLKMWAMQPLPGVQLTVISDVVETPYSGMLPGHIAGFYAFDDCHIDLRPLATAAGARLIIDCAIGLDLANQRVLCANRPTVAFDLLSIDIGSTPNTLTIPGAKDYAIPAKPISQLLQYWQTILEHTINQPSPLSPLTLGIVGGGVGGVELALAMQSRLRKRDQTAGQSPDCLTIHLFQRSDRLVPERPPPIGRRLLSVLETYGIQVHLGETVTAVSAKDTPPQHPHQVQNYDPPLAVTCNSGLTLACHHLFWVTQATAAPWLQAAGLATDDRGFIQVNDYLQSTSHPQVFAAGDIATMVRHPRPKAGVFAVRQGSPLFHNLHRALSGQSLRPYSPQRDFLTLIGTGDRQAIALRNAIISPPSSLLWCWKDWIDRRFMAQFTNLQPMADRSPRSATKTQPKDQPRSPSSGMPCAGCGSKVGRDSLKRSLTRLQQDYPQKNNHSDILIGLDTADDAAVVKVPDGQVLVQTVDHFRALVNDPFLLGQITANHCLSDLFAMGAEAHSALAIVTLPYALSANQEETLFQLLAGTLKTLHQANATLIGGHTTEGTELVFGLACNGFAHPNQLWQKSDLHPGQTLILTKALGTGTLFAADMQLKAKGRWIETAIHSMLQSNQAAASILRQYGATACTDVTGFGLLGHLQELLGASSCAAHLDLDTLPILEGALATTQQGILSSLHPQNLQAVRALSIPNQANTHPYFPLLFDPQTSGGLLATIPTDQASACLTHLHRAGYRAATAIGHLHEGTGITLVNT